MHFFTILVIQEGHFILTDLHHQCKNAALFMCWQIRQKTGRIQQHFVFIKADCLWAGLCQVSLKTDDFHHRRHTYIVPKMLTIPERLPVTPSSTMCSFRQCLTVLGKWQSSNLDKGGRRNCCTGTDKWATPTHKKFLMRSNIMHRILKLQCLMV